MKLAKRLFLIVFAAMTIAPFMGCGVATTAAENKRMVNRVADFDSRMLVDDLSLLFQTNRNLRTSRWIID
ncbi:MAG: hypothetical protein IPK83_07400 [Planctomycetes bacterium]|nr:hypothetical protein [Planctomycetota bacterium]